MTRTYGTPEPPERSNRRPGHVPPKTIPPLKLPPVPQNAAPPSKPPQPAPSSSPARAVLPNPSSAAPLPRDPIPAKSVQEPDSLLWDEAEAIENDSDLNHRSDSGSDNLKEDGFKENILASTVSSAVPFVNGSSRPASKEPVTTRPFWFKLSARHLHWWAVILVFGLSGIGILSAIALLRLPSLPNCPEMFLPTASASLRLYCAQVAAEKRTLKDLLEAIDLVHALPADHPLRPEIDRSIEAWASEILDLAEGSFQAGKLNEAVDAARKIPSNTAAHKLVEDRVKLWQTVWSKAEALYKQAEAALKQQNVRQAFLLTSRLSDVDNRYWATTKYQELSNLITITRDDIGKLNRAKGLIDRGGVDNLLAALKLIEEIKPVSYVYGKAQQMLPDLGRELFALAEAALDRRDYSQAMNITSLIPESAKLQSEVQDFNTLAMAQSQAWGGTVDDLEAAIIGAQRIKSDRPLYSKAQQWISRWQVEIKDVTILDRAKELAAGGTLDDLRVAIAEAQLIPRSNPRGTEARDQINEWRTQIETTEDQPFLDRADQFANDGDIAALQAAINEASRIQSGRALYGEAQDRIRGWRDRVEQFQDQPILDQARQLAAGGDWNSAIQVASQIGNGRSLHAEAQDEIRTWRDRAEDSIDKPLLDRARQLANQGRYGDAIEVATQIGSGRSLYDEAQSDIQEWSQQSQGQSEMQEAYRAASAGSTRMLISAIRIANRIPSGSLARAEADRMIDQWSQEILQRAESQALYDVTGAIRIAKSIPSSSSIYESAQQQIQVWQSRSR
ncbi:hypothetical protein NDI45_02950 [Leptolyngbya sp. GB1-A1]|uniref:chromosome segregation ATPase n=1 Tax=Leptolyngbya sp. GB1-A1 TaxID=2933908 RepID=UPI0032986536